MALAEQGSLHNVSSTDLGMNSPVPSDLLKGVVAYVEVRTANDNRSAAVKRVLERMGAKVEEKFTDDITHVIFKEGKKRTRDKARKLGVHLVSVLWVDSCKEKQARVPEEEFWANTQHCDTPPPGVRWKKYKSMQPRDFEDELARSTERCQKRQRRLDTQRCLLQGSESATPIHSPANVLVVDTQPFFPAVMDLQTPVIIPSTPPSMQARLNQLMQQREARKHTEAKESPLCSRIEQDLPLQRALFKSRTPAQEEDKKKSVSNKPVSARRSARLSCHISSTSVPSDVSDQQRDVNCGHPIRASLANETVISSAPLSKSSGCAQSSGNSGADVPSSADSFGSKFNGTDRQRSRSDTEMQVLSDVIQSKMLAQKKRGSRKSLPSSLLSSVPHTGAGISLEAQKNQDTKATASVPHCSVTQHKTRCMRPQSAVNSCEKENESSSDDSSTRDGSVTFSVGQKKRKRYSSSRKGRSYVKDVKCGNSDSTAESASEKSSQQSLSAGLKTVPAKPAAKKRKLLNPSQEMHILSSSPQNDSNVLKPVPAGQTQKQKRLSCDVNAVFPSLPPVPKRGCKKSHVKENRGKRKTASQRASSSRVDSMSDPNSDRQTTKGRKEKNSVTGADQSVGGNSTVFSTSQSSSILGASMSMVFGDTSTASKRLAPPRSSIAEFKVGRPLRQSQASVGTVVGTNGTSSSQRRGQMSLQKFHLTCMPSLVMTSLHRPEQDLVIAAVKRLGVFRIEDKVSRDTTHVVCGESRRTLNLLHGMARGCWVVSKDWVLRSLEDGQWLSEADYEVTEAFPKVKETRLAREAAAPESYQCRLFEMVGSLFISNTSSPPRAQLVRLLQLCGAKVTDSIHRASFYIGDESHDDKTSVRSVWVLDCISQQQVLPMDDYILAINYKAKSSSSPEF